MTLTKYYPSRVNSLNNVSDFIDHLFDGSFRGDIRHDYIPAADIKETEKAYVISMDVPGMAKNELNIKLENNVLSISGEKKVEEEKENDKYHLIERRIGSFERSFRLPDDVDDNKISASVENGILQVEIQKSAKALPKTIDIQIK